MTLRIAALLSLTSLAAWAEPVAPQDTQLTDARGQEKLLKAYLGRPVIVIYEDRAAQSQNVEFKEDLARVGKDPKYQQLVRVLAIADLSSFNWFPARQFAQASVRSTEESLRIPILIDWTGQMSGSPWSLPKSQSSVLVLDAEGQVLFRKSGTLRPEERTEALSLLRQLVAVTNR